MHRLVWLNQQQEGLTNVHWDCPMSIDTAESVKCPETWFVIWSHPKKIGKSFITTPILVEFSVSVFLGVAICVMHPSFGVSFQTALQQFDYWKNLTEETVRFACQQKNEMDGFTLVVCLHCLGGCHYDDDMKLGFLSRQCLPRGEEVAWFPTTEKHTLWDISNVGWFIAPISGRNGWGSNPSLILNTPLGNHI